MKKGYLLVTALVLLAAVAMFVSVIVSVVSNTSSLRVMKEELFMASNDSMNGLQMGTSYIAHFANSIGGFDLDFNGVGSTPFSSITWLQSNTPNNYFTSIYSSIDGDAWKSALSVLATDSNVLWLNKIPKVESFFESLRASGTLKTIPDVVIIQAKKSNMCFVVSRAVVKGKVAYSSGFVTPDYLNKYLYFTQEEPPYSFDRNVTFMTGDVLDGPVRTNSTFVTLGKPEFKGRVEYRGLYEVSGYGSPEFDVFPPIKLSQDDINSMNMLNIASDYSAQINSEVSSPASIESAVQGDLNFPIGIDLSKINLDSYLNWDSYGFEKDGSCFDWEKGGYYTPSQLASMFQQDLGSWLEDNETSYDDLPQDVQDQYQKAFDVIKSIGMPAVKVTFDSNGNSKTMNVYYSNTPIVSSAIDAIDELINNGYWWNWYPWLKLWYYDGPDFSDVLSVLDKSNGNNWGPLFTIKPATNSSVPGTVTLIPEGNAAATILGLSSSSPITFKFNGVLKTSSNLYISGEKNQQGNNDKTAYVSGKYTLYTTKNTYIQSNIVYDCANKIFGVPGKSNKSWISSEVSTSMVQKLRNSNCSDFLNIVSNGDIALADDSPQNLKLMSSLYSFRGKFWFPNYKKTWHGKTGQMFVYGSMMQYEGGQLFGTYSGNSLVSGYQTYYAFDRRILEGLPSYMCGTPSVKGKAMLLSVRAVY